MRQFAKLVTLLSLITSSLATTVSFRYNDGILWREVEMELLPGVDGRGIRQFTGSHDLNDVDIYAFEILDGPENVYCTFHKLVEDPEEDEVTTEKTGPSIYKFHGLAQFMTIRTHVVRIDCVVRYRPRRDVIRPPGGFFATYINTHPALFPGLDFQDDDEEEEDVYEDVYADVYDDWDVGIDVDLDEDLDENVIEGVNEDVSENMSEDVTENVTENVNEDVYDDWDANINVDPDEDEDGDEQ